MWLQWEVKTANFDTWCGYDLEYLFAAGVEATISFVRNAEYDQRNSVLELLLDDQGQATLSDENLSVWRHRQRSRFPSDPAALDPLDAVRRAKLIGDFALARQTLEQWAYRSTRDEESLARLGFELAELGAFEDAARVQREILQGAETPWAAAAAWQTLAALQRRAGDPNAAWDALRECRLALADVQDGPDSVWAAGISKNSSFWPIRRRASSRS